MEIGIGKHIRTRWTEYAQYILKQRGIPNFYDGLTNSQRIILLCAPQKSTKSVSVIGSCIKSGYAHGNISLESSLNNLAKRWGSGENLLTGDGFFGTQISNEAAAARYTSVYITPKISDLINAYRPINEYYEEGMPKHFHVETPIGLATGNTGIAIGFKSKILPRSLKTVNDYLAGNRKSAPPSFQDFTGKIKRLAPNRWKISGTWTKSTRGQKVEYTVTQLPPTLKAERFLEQLERLKDSVNISLVNNSRDQINLKVRVNSQDEEVLDKWMEKNTSKTETENVIFIRDGVLKSYNSITEYLDEFKEWKKDLKIKWSRYLLETKKRQESWVGVKISFMQFMLKGKRDKTEIREWITANNTLDYTSKLESIPAWKINISEIQDQNKMLNALQSEIRDLNLFLKQNAETQ